ncbi:undecaprenyl-phosphate glucose phosphotransferase [Robbsia sp. KACC 23696]|uniref:undecaprenyl-phosphate glucose phosphotransferase n=1 Tax=Robbsia sp. KACC 23696 TaxID=3149231 RepID=UPI00325B3026
MLPLMARLIDILVVALSGIVTHLVFGGNGHHPWSNVDYFMLVFNSLGVVLLFPGLNIYQSWRGKQIGELLVRVMFAWLVVMVFAVAVVFGLQRTHSLSREWVGTWFVTCGILLVLSKSCFYALLKNIRRQGLNQRAVVIVGSGGYCRAVLSRIRTAPQAGFRAVCVLEEDPSRDIYSAEFTPIDAAYARAPEALQPPQQIAGVPVLSSFDELVRMVRQRRVHEIWLALPLSEERNIMRYMREFRNDFVNIRFIPDVRSLSLFNHSIIDLLGLPAINLTGNEVAELQVLPKLIFDRLFAAVVLLMLSPLLISIAIAVKMSSHGPVFFKQRRKGVDGREFEIYKFRSMKVHTEAAGVITQAKKVDPRITKVGAFLRRTSLDELPQFINVLRGEMSVVGPRPHAIAHDDLYKDQVDGYMYRYRIKPGITGWAQVNGFRGETDRVEKMEARVKFDLYYIQHWSFWFDMKIVLLTIVKGFIGSNAY